VSGTRVRDQILAQKMLLGPLPLGRLQRFLEFWPGAGDKGQNTYLLYQGLPVCKRSRRFCAGNNSFALVLSTILTVSVCISQMSLTERLHHSSWSCSLRLLLQRKQRARLSQLAICPPDFSLGRLVAFKAQRASPCS